jgi:hypothetical protein
MSASAALIDDLRMHHIEKNRFNRNRSEEIKQAGPRQ